MGAASTDTPHGIPPGGFNSLAAVVRHLTAVATGSLPRLVVLDDVWEREVVDTMFPTGLVLMVTARDESVVAVPGGTRTDVGDMTEDEASILLRRASGSVGSPGSDIQAAIRRVIFFCVVCKAVGACVKRGLHARVESNQRGELARSIIVAAIVSRAAMVEERGVVLHGRCSRVTTTDFWCRLAALSVDSVRYRPHVCDVSCTMLGLNVKH